MLITLRRKYWAQPIVSSLFMYWGFHGQLRRKIFVHQLKDGKAIPVAAVKSDAAKEVLGNV